MDTNPAVPDQTSDAVGGAPSPGGRLLRPAATCPRCGARPALRITPLLVAAVAGQPAGARVATYQCQRRGCGAVYDLTAQACQRSG